MYVQARRKTKKTQGKQDGNSKREREQQGLRAQLRDSARQRERKETQQCVRQLRATQTEQWRARVNVSNIIISKKARTIANIIAEFLCVFTNVSVFYDQNKMLSQKSVDLNTIQVHVTKWPL